MGLSGPRKRAKLSHDPNNTAWSRSDARFGHKLLISSGWTPGSSLGVGGTPYANNSASISHVRITAKNDNFGLGAGNNGHSDEAPTTGLAGLQDLLGRLNGKDEKVLEKEHGRREDTRRALYAESRWGPGSFVSGGFLDADNLRKRGDKSVESAAVAVAISANSLSPRAQAGKSYKKKEAKSEKKRESSSPIGINELELSTSSTTHPPSQQTSDIGDKQAVQQWQPAKADAIDAQRRLKKMERKAQRRARKAERQAGRALERKSQNPPDPSLPVSKVEERASQMPELGKAQGRHAVRQRFIQHKKMSMTDRRALNEILMIRG
ncbi:MAG: hypothetical protein Q9210_000644 [Variospora velana]